MTREQRQAPWIPCPACGDFLCTIHGLHVYDCPCPGIEVWARRNLDPYAPLPAPKPKRRAAAKPTRRTARGS